MNVSNALQKVTRPHKDLVLSAQAAVPLVHQKLLALNVKKASPYSLANAFNCCLILATLQSTKSAKSVMAVTPWMLLTLAS